MASTTLTNYRRNISAILGLDNSTSGDQTLIDFYVNEGYEDFVRRTRCKVAWADMDLTSGTYTYTLSTTPLQILEVKNNDGTDDWLMERTTLADLNNMRRAQAAAPARWYAVEGHNMLVLYPTPGSGETLTIWYVPRPTALSGASDVPSDVPAEFHQAIEFYALSRMGEYDNHGPSQFGSFWLARYEVMVREATSANRKQGGQRAARAKVGRRDRVAVQRDPARIPY